MKDLKSSTAPDKRKPNLWRHSLVRLSVRQLLVLLTVVAILAAWLKHHHGHHQKEQAWLQQLAVAMKQTRELKAPNRSPDGSPNGMSELMVVVYDYQCKKDGTIDPEATCLTPAWLGRLLGEHFFHRVHSLTINSWDNSDQVDFDEFYRDVSLSSLDGIEALSNLKHLNLFTTNELRNLDAIANLHRLESLATNLPIPLETINGLSRLQKLDIRSGGVISSSASPLTGKLRSLRVSWDSEMENLSWCGNLQQLRSLELSHCRRLQSLASASGFSSLDTVKLESCPLRDIDALSGTPVKNLSIKKCGAGGALIISSDNAVGVSKTAAALNPNGIAICFPQLEKFEFGRAQPQRLASLGLFAGSPNLQTIRVSGLQFKDIQGITSLNGLRELTMAGCQLPEAIVVKMPQLQKMELVACSGLQRLEGQLNGLTSLTIDHCRDLEKVDVLSAESALKKIVIERPGDQLVEIDFLAFASELKEFRLSDSRLTDLGCLARADQLEIVDIENSAFVRDLSVLKDKNSLKVLNLSSLPKLEQLDVSNLDSLQGLSLRHLSRLKHLKLQNLNSLKTLTLEYARSITRLDVSTLDSLERLTLVGSGLVDLVGISNLDSLEEIVLSFNRKLQPFGDLSKLPKLKEIHVEACPAINKPEAVGDNHKPTK